MKVLVMSHDVIFFFREFSKTFSLRSVLHVRTCTQRSAGQRYPNSEYCTIIGARKHVDRNRIVPHTLWTIHYT
jgi:hypothetical protein